MAGFEEILVKFELGIREWKELRSIFTPICEKFVQFEAKWSLIPSIP
jgi:hypothetical protein